MTEPVFAAEPSSAVHYPGAAGVDPVQYGFGIYSGDRWDSSGITVSWDTVCSIDHCGTACHVFSGEKAGL